jgi:hypothetical protein
MVGMSVLPPPPGVVDETKRNKTNYIQRATKRNLQSRTIRQDILAPSLKPSQINCHLLLIHLSRPTVDRISGQFRPIAHALNYHSFTG